MTDQAKLEAALYAANETIRLKDARIRELEAENEWLRNVRRIEIHPECEPDAYFQARGAVVPTATHEHPEVIIRRLREADHD